MTTNLLFTLPLALLVAGSAYAKDEKGHGSLIVQAYETCGSIRGEIEVLFHEARAQCQPANDNGKIGILIFSTIPVLSIKEAKEALFIAAVAAVGLEARSRGIGGYGGLYVIDPILAKTLESYSISIARASDLQIAVHDGQLSATDFKTSVLREMQLSKLPAHFLGEASNQMIGPPERSLCAGRMTRDGCQPK